MGFGLFLIYVVFSFIRPAELYPDLERFQIMEIATMAALAGAIPRLLAGRGPTFRATQIYLAIFFVLWTAFSVVAASRWLGGATGAIDGFRGSGLIFLLAVLHIDTLGRFRLTVGLLGALGVLLVGQSLYSYHTGWRARDFQIREQLNADGELEEVREEAAFETAASDAGAAPTSQTVIVRARSLGFLNDPNDFAQALVALAPFLFAARTQGRRLRNALVVWLPAAAVFYGIVLTRSRGAIVAMLVALFLALRKRLGRMGGLAVAVAIAVAMIAFGFAGGREIGMDDSAGGRTAAWSEGLQLLKDSPIWGVGFGAFTDYNDLVAHNSFVHCAAELGLVGYFLWLALIVTTLTEMVDLAGHEGVDVPGEEYAHAARAMQISLAAFLAGAFFLSRSYGVMLFLLLGLGTALGDIGRRDLGDVGGRPALSWVRRTLTVEAASLAGIWILVRILR
jgi:putative inorganic carbon (hco3(-)) transporter